MVEASAMTAATATRTRTRATAPRRHVRSAPARRGAAARRPTRRTYALRRALVSLVVLALLVAAFSAGMALRSDAADTASMVQATVVVAEGDTVWDIAVAYLPEGANTHAYVAQVLEHNDLDAAAVRPGTVLRLPR